MNNHIKLAKFVWRWVIRISQSNMRNNLDLVYSSHRFALSCAVFYFWLFLCFGLFFYADLYLFDSHVFTSVIGIYDLAHPGLFPNILQALDSACVYIAGEALKVSESCSRGGIEGVLFAHSFMLSLPVSVGAASYYFVRHGAEHDRAGDASFYFCGYFIPIMVHFVLGWGIMFMFVMGGYILIVLIPAKLSLHSIPLFFIAQIFLNAIAFQLIAGGLTSQWKPVFPYSLHPARRTPA